AALQSLLTRIDEVESLAQQLLPACALWSAHDSCRLSVQLHCACACPLHIAPSLELARSLCSRCLAHRDVQTCARPDRVSFHDHDWILDLAIDARASVTDNAYAAACEIKRTERAEASQTQDPAHDDHAH